MGLFNRQRDVYSGEILQAAEPAHVVKLNPERLYFDPATQQYHVLLSAANNPLVVNQAQGKVGLGLSEQTVAEIADMYGKSVGAEGKFGKGILVGIVAGVVGALGVSVALPSLLNNSNQGSTPNVLTPSEPTASAQKNQEPTAEPSPTESTEPSAPSPSASPTSLTTADLSKYTIVLDPQGVSGSPKIVIDSSTKLRDKIYSSGKGVEDSFAVAQQVAAGLKASGVGHVYLTKKNAEDVVSSNERALLAAKKKATLTISIDFNPGNPDTNLVMEQTIGDSLQNLDKQGKRTGEKIEFEDPNSPCLSQGSAKTIAAVRTEFEGRASSIDKIKTKTNGYLVGNTMLPMLLQGAGDYAGGDSVQGGKVGVPWIWLREGTKDFTDEDIAKSGDATLRGIIKVLENQKTIKLDCGIAK